MSCSESMQTSDKNFSYIVIFLFNLMESVKNCGCKGIRTCLICEKEGNVSKIDDANKETARYEYCPSCDLCWPLGNDCVPVPLYLGRLTLIPEFITAEEENEIVAAIDSMDWMLSQSGRRKQDFGPKVNFKKKKGKIGDFKGFPSFTKDLINRLGQHGDLSDFHPVELCHLDYDPDRGSAIEPHIDDTWIWGERLVTLNLVSPTVLIFTPENAEEICDCRFLNTSICSSNEMNQFNGNISLDCRERSNMSVCKSNATNIPLNCSSSDCSPGVLDSRLVNDKYISNIVQQDKLKEPLGCQSKCPSNAGSIIKNNYCIHNCPVHLARTKDVLDSKDPNPNADIGQTDPKTIHDNQSQCFRTPNEIKLCSHKKLLSCSHERHLDDKQSSPVEDMCTAYRIGHKGLKIEVFVPLPARSLVVVAGCSRHNWFHEIRRKDIASRRLAMTFRELSQNFMSGGSDEILGNELLELGRTFWEMKV